MQFIPSLRSFELPLLFKELIERAQRRRTYVVRMFAAILMYAWVFVTNYKILLAFDPLHPEGNLGQGKLILDAMVFAETFGLYLCLPAICCGVIAGEKENNTLPLLFVTRLRPWTIVFEKYLSCLVMAVSFLLLATPCMMITYPLGGLSFSNLLLAIWSLILTSGVVISIGLLSSTWCRTVSGAVILGYVLNLLLLVGPLFLVEVILGSNQFWQTSIGSFLLQMFPSTGDAFLYPFSLYFFYRGLPVGWDGGSLLTLLHHSLPCFLQIFICLSLSRVFLIRRSDGQGRNWLRAGFGKLDILFKMINNNRLTRGVVVSRRQYELPEDHPIAWRETTRTALTNPVHLIRLWIGLFTPPAIVFLVSPVERLSGRISFFYAIYLIVAVLTLIVKSTTAISSERSRQTLDVLLATPTSPRDLLKEKMRGIWRLYFVLTSILIPLMAINWWLSLDFWNSYPYAKNTWITHPISNLIFLLIDLPIAIWISLLIGMTSRSSGRSVILSLGIIFAWWIPPLFLMENFLARRDPVMQQMFYPCLYVFPLAKAVIGTWYSPISTPESICFWFAITAGYYLCVLIAFRFWMMRNAGRFLSRLETSVKVALQSSA